MCISCKSSKNVTSKHFSRLSSIWNISIMYLLLKIRHNKILIFCRDIQVETVLFGAHCTSVSLHTKHYRSNVRAWCARARPTCRVAALMTRSRRAVLDARNCRGSRLVGPTRWVHRRRGRAVALSRCTRVSLMASHALQQPGRVHTNPIDGVREVYE